VVKALNIILSKNLSVEDKMMREVYCNTLMELARENDRITVLDADLMFASSMLNFAKEFHERAFNCGVQEANMIGVAAGMSATGMIPYVHSFGTFATRRCYDQIFISAAYAKLNIRIVGSDPGITATFNGGTHMPFEDAGIMRNIPEVTVIELVDSVMLKDIVRQIAGLYGVFYIRLFRRNATRIYEEGSTFKIGKAIELRDGKDATVISSGILVAESLKAADLLEKEGILIKVVNMFTWKPIDRETIIKCAEQTGSIVTAENHNIINGLGSAVAEVLAETDPIPMERIGSRDLFGEVGTQDYLMRRYEMTAEDIAKKVRKVIARKRNDYKYDKEIGR